MSKDRAGSCSARMRSIRSFARRSGRITASQKGALKTLYPVYGLSANAGILPLHTIFGRVAPCVFEIGFGMGDSLVDMAAQHPELNFIGVDVYSPGVGHVLGALRARNVPNVRIFHADAWDVLAQCIADDALLHIQLFFPDPWPKRRHHKRRLIQADFVRLLHQKLSCGGIIHIATDWEPYAQHIRDVFEQLPALFREFANDSAPILARPLTKFEKRGRSLEHDIWELVFRKI